LQGHPYYWASFVQYGNTTVIDFERNKKTWYFFTAGFLLLFLIVYLIYKFIKNQQHIS